MIRCPKICKEYKIVVSKYEIEKLNIKDIKVLFDIISYIEDFKAKAKCNIMEVIFIIGIVLIAFGVYLFLKDFTYMLQGVILMILGASILGISLS